MPIRRARRAVRDKELREQAVKDFLGPNGHNIFRGVLDSVKPQDGMEPQTVGFAIPANSEEVVLPEVAQPAAALPEQLQRAADLALADAIETLEMRVDKFNKNFVQMKKLKAQAQATVVGILSRVSPGSLKGQSLDKVGELLDRLKSGG